MSTPPNESRTECPSWSQALTRMLAWQLNFLETHYRVGFNVMEASLGFLGGARGAADRRTVPDQQPGDDVRTLQALACEQINKGLAPPKEIYSLPYRNRIDWAKFPSWARPCDPELFEGAGHEG